MDMIIIDRHALKAAYPDKGNLENYLVPISKNLHVYLQEQLPNGVKLVGNLTIDYSPDGYWILITVNRVPRDKDTAGADKHGGFPAKAFTFEFNLHAFREAYPGDYVDLEKVSDQDTLQSLWRTRKGVLFITVCAALRLKISSVQLGRATLDTLHLNGRFDERELTVNVTPDKVSDHGFTLLAVADNLYSYYYFPLRRAVDHYTGQEIALIDNTSTYVTNNHDVNTETSNGFTKSVSVLSPLLATPHPHCGPEATADVCGATPGQTVELVRQVTVSPDPSKVNQYESSLASCASSITGLDEHFNKQVRLNTAKLTVESLVSPLASPIKCSALERLLADTLPDFQDFEALPPVDYHAERNTPDNERSPPAPADVEEATVKRKADTLDTLFPLKVEQPAKVELRLARTEEHAPLPFHGHIQGIGNREQLFDAHHAADLASLRNTRQCCAASTEPPPPPPKAEVTRLSTTYSSITLPGTGVQVDYKNTSVLNNIDQVHISAPGQVSAINISFKGGFTLKHKISIARSQRQEFRATAGLIHHFVSSAFRDINKTVRLRSTAGVAQTLLSTGDASLRSAENDLTKSELAYTILAFCGAFNHNLQPYIRRYQEFSYSRAACHH